MKQNLNFPRAGAIRALAGIVLSCLWGVQPAHAALRTWTGAGANAFWSTASNWSPAGAPQNGEDLSFPAGAPRRTNTNDLPARTFGFILFNGTDSDYELKGNGITLSRGLNAVNVPQLLAPQIFFDIRLGQSLRFVTDDADIAFGRVDLAGHTLTLNTTTSNSFLFAGDEISGVGDVVKIGVGEVLFGGPFGNSYQGTTHVAEGTLRIGKGNGGPPHGVPGPLIIGDTDEDDFFVSTRGRVELLRANMIDDAALITFRNGTLDLNGFDETVGPLRILTGGIVTGTGILFPIGPISQFTRFPAGSSDFIGGRVFLAADVTFDLNSSRPLRISASISGPGGLIKEGQGVLTLSGTNDFTGSVTVNHGMLELESPRALDGTAGVTLNESGILGLRDITVANKSLTINSRDAGLVTSLDSCTWNGAIHLNFTMGMARFTAGNIFGSTASLRVLGSIQGTGGLWLGGETVELLGNNTFTGPVRSACRLLLLNTGAGRPFSGPLEVGGGYSSLNDSLGIFTEFEINPTAEVRWSRDFQNSNQPLTVRSNGFVNLNDHFENFSTITFHGGRIDTGIGTLGLFGDVTVRSNNPPAVINGQISLRLAEHLFDVGAGGNPCDLDLNATLNGTADIIKDGFGVMCLRRANGATFGGLATVNAGTLTLANDTALGSTSNGTIVRNGATVSFGFQADNVTEPFTIEGAGVGGTSGALLSANDVWINADVVLTGAASIRAEGTNSRVQVNNLSGTGPLTKLGGGRLVLRGNGNNTYSGDTVVNEGVLDLAKPFAVTSVPGHLIIGAGSAGIAPLARVEHRSSFTIIGSVTVNRGGLWDLNGSSEGWSIADLQGRPPLTLNEGGDVQTGAGIFFLPTGGDIAVGPGNVGGSVISDRIGLDPGPHRFNVGGSISFLADLELDVPAAISQTSTSAEFVKEGFGRLRLSASNSLGGAVRVNAGTLIVSNDFALGGNLAGTSVSNNAALVLEGSRFINNEVLTLSSSNTAAFRTTSGSNTWTGPIVLARDTTVSVSPANGFLQALNNTISGPGGLTKLGPGTLQFRGSVANTYGGLTTVAAGLLEAGRVNVISVPGDAVIGDDSTSTTTATLRCLRDQQFRPTGNVTVNRSGHLHLFPLAATPAPQPTLNTVRGQGNISIPFTTSLTISNDVSFELAATVTGTGALNKRRALTTVQVTSESFFGGPTTVHEGFWRMDGNWPASPLTVKSDGELRGDGALGNLTVETNGIVRPNSNVPGRLGADLEMSSANFLAGGRLGLALYGPHPTGGNDSLVANGPVTLNNTRLSAGFQYPPREGDVAVLLRKNSAGPINGVFSGFVEGVTRQLGDVTVRATYLGGDGNDFTLTVTNLPLTFLSYGLTEGNGNQTVEPDECNLLFIALTNRRPASLTITSAVVRAVTPSAVVTIASARYPAIPAGAARNIVTPFQFRTEPAFPCGTAAQFELVIGVLNEGEFAVAFTVPGGDDCAHPTGGCESCVVVSGQFTPATATLPRPHIFAGAPSICFPAKPCPEGDNFPEGLAVPLIVHSFTNSTTNKLCVTAQLRFGCLGAPTNALGAVAYLHTNAVQSACVNYLGDTGADGTQPFSFRVPPLTNFVVLVSARDTNVVCDRYTLELFGLPCPPPRLDIARDAAPGRVRASWSSAYPDFRLHSLGAMTGTTPFPFTNSPVVPALVGGKYTTTNSTVDGQQFYRLAK